MTGLPEANRIATAIVTKSGDAMINIPVATHTSMHRFALDLHQREGVAGIGCAETLTNFSVSGGACEHMSAVLLSDGRHAGDYSLDFGFGHVREDRQRKTA